MRLNYDYVRDVLIFVEKELVYKDADTIYGIHSFMPYGKLLTNSTFDKHNKAELLYALELLIKEGYIECSNPPNIVNGDLKAASIIGLSWKGHELLNDIRDNTVWNAVKEKASKFGGLSLTALVSGAKFLSSALMTDPTALENFKQGIQNISNLI